MILPFMALQTLASAIFFMVLYLVHVPKAKFLRRVMDFSVHGPPTYPIIGCLISFYKNRLRLLDWYTQLLSRSPTSTIVVWRLGARCTIVTANPENVEYILRTNFKNYPKGKPFTEILGDFLGNGIFNADGELWRSQRKLVSHEFSTNSLREYVMSTLHEEVENRLLPVMESLVAKKEVVDLQDLLKRLTFDMICKVSLGIDDRHRCLDPAFPISPLAEAFDVSSEICAQRGAATMSLSWKIKRWIGVGSEWKLKEAVQEVHRYISRVLRDRIKKIDDTGDFSTEDLLSRLILSGYDERTIRDLMISFIMAGRDTTSAAMTWLFWLLSQHPNVKQDLVKEIELIVKERNCLDYESLKELRLLNACLCESMRLYPPVAWDSKHAIEDDVLPDGTIVKSGNRVTYFPYGMGRMEKLWGKDRFEFKPSRWLLEPEGRVREMRKVCPFKFPVFQAGPRDCIGKEMAFLQMKYVVASLLHRFDIKPVNQSCPVFVPFLTAHMAGGFPVVISERNIS